MSNTQIHSGKMLKSGIKVVCTQGESKATKAKAVFEFKDAIPHPDLIKKQKALTIHFAILSGALKDDEIKVTGGKAKKEPKFQDKETEENFRVTGINISEKGIMMLTGQKYSEYSGWITQNVKVSQTTEDETDGYPYIDDLEEKFNLVAVEYAEFIENGKQGEDPQLKLNLGDGDDGNPPADEQ